MIERRKVSGDGDVMRVASFDANRIRGASAQNMSVEVLQTAASQRNEGQALVSGARAVDTGFAAGAHRIAVTVGDRQFDIDINVSADDTNQDVQRRIAAAINNRSDIAVTASVAADSAEGTSSLILSSSATGVDRQGQPNFTVRSVSGNAVEMAGIGEIAQEARNAQFRVNAGFTGALQTSRSNNADLGFGIRAELRGPGTSRLEMARDEAAQVSAFRDMADSFNGLLQAARDAGRGGALERDLGMLARSFGSDLERVGITFGQDGFMRLDEGRMAAAAGNGDLERFATRGGTGFMSRLSRLAETAARNPVPFIDAGRSQPGFAGSGIMFTPAQASRMSGFSTLGILFDALR
jgi:hypothetical protein